MSLDKAIEHGKENRKPYRGSKAIDPTCRNHGGCPWCEENRKHKFRDKHPQEKGEEWQEQYMNDCNTCEHIQECAADGRILEYKHDDTPRYIVDIGRFCPMSITTQPFVTARMMETEGYKFAQFYWNHREEYQTLQDCMAAYVRHDT